MSLSATSLRKEPNLMSNETLPGETWTHTTYNLDEIGLDPDAPNLTPEQAQALRQLHAFLETNHLICDPILHDYRGRPIAVMRGIGPHNILIAIITWITVFGGCMVISLLYNTFFAR